MEKIPKHTNCGECNHPVKLKSSEWELWTDGDSPVGMSQQRECNRCKSLVLSAIGNEEFITTIVRHYSGSPVRH